MIIITDNIDIASGYLNEDLKWVQWDRDNHNNFLTSSIKEFFDDKQVYCAESSRQKLWEYVFITESATVSHMTSFDNLLSREGLDKNILALSETGEEFKGFRDRPWEALTGNIHMSAHVAPNVPATHAYIGFTILLAVSTIQTINDLKVIKGKCGIKWVNDIMIDGNKVAGILARSRLSGSKITNVILGIGLNVESKPEISPTSMEYQAACLNEFVKDGHKLSHFEVFRILEDRIIRNYELLLNKGYEKLLKAYKKKSIVLGKEVVIWSDPLFGSPEKIHEGKVVEIGDNLELYFENAPEPVISGRIRSIKA